MKTLTILAFSVLFLTGCATSGLEAGQGSVDQNVRGGIFASYTGTHGVDGKPGTTTIKGVVDDKEIDLEVTSSAPFIVTIGDVQADTDVGTQGQTADTNTSNPSTETDVPVEVPVTR